METSTLVAVLSIAAGVILGVLSIAVAALSVIAASTIEQAKRILSQNIQVRRDVMDIRESLDELQDKQREKLMIEYIQELDCPETRLNAIKSLSEVGNEHCTLRLMGIIETDPEQENREEAKLAMISIVGRVKKPLSQALPLGTGIQDRYIDIFVNACSNVIEKIQKRRALRKLK